MIDSPECKETNKTECVFLKKNYNSIDLTEVEQIDEFVDDTNETVREQYRPPIGPILTQVCLPTHLSNSISICILTFVSSIDFS